jgi:hypothetical protein
VQEIGVIVLVSVLDLDNSVLFRLHTKDWPRKQPHNRSRHFRRDKHGLDQHKPETYLLLEGVKQCCIVSLYTMLKTMTEAISVRLDG